MENFTQMVDSYVLSNIRQNHCKFVIDVSAAYENVKRFSSGVEKFEANVLDFGRIKKARPKLYFDRSYSELTKKRDELMLLVGPENNPQIYAKTDTPLRLAAEIEEVNSVERKTCSLELVSSNKARLAKLVNESDVGNGISNARHIKYPLSRTCFKDCDDFLSKSNCKPLLKTVEVHKGKTFVRMVPVSFSGQIKADDSTLERREKLVDEKCSKQTIVKNPTYNFDMLNFLIDENIYNSILSTNSCFLSKFRKHLSYSPGLISNKVGSKDSVREMYRFCFLPKEEDIKLSGVWDNAAEGLAEEGTSNFKLYLNSIHSNDKAANLNFPNLLIEKENGGISCKSRFSLMSNSNESEDEREMIASLDGRLLNCQKHLNHLEETYEKVRKVLFTAPFYCNRTDRKDFATPEPTLLTDSICNYHNPHRKESCNTFEISSTPNSHKMKTNGLQNSQDDHRSTLQNSGRCVFHLNDNCERPFQENTSHSISLKQNNKNSFENSQNGTSFSNECDDEFLRLPSEESLILFNDILLRLENTYEIVRKDVYAWLTSNYTVRNVGDNSNCDTVKALIDERSSVFNSNNCIMKFEGRNLDAIGRKYHNSTPSDSTSVSGLHSFMEILEHSSTDGSESELDDSESSLDGSFKQFNRAESRESMTSTDSDHSGGIPRFSLPSNSRRQNCPTFHTLRTTEYLDKVSSREWSWKSGEKEFTIKCAQRERRWRSEAQADIENPEDLCFNEQYRNSRKLDV